MDLYFLRHGIAVDQGTAGYRKDSERPLTDKGEAKTWQTAKALGALEVSFDLVLSSPYVRARQTAEIIAQALKLKKKLQLIDTLKPGGDSRVLVRVLTGLASAPESVLLVGHEPDLSQLVSLLVSGDKGMGLVFKKGGLCKVGTDGLKHGQCGALEWLLTPKQMDLMA